MDNFTIHFRNFFARKKNWGIFLLGIFSFLGTHEGCPYASAHPLLPFEVVEFAEANPDATTEDLEKFFLENFGTVEEYFGIPVEEQDFTLTELLTPPENLEAGDGTELSAEEQARLRKNMEIFLSLRDEPLNFRENAGVFTVLGIEHILIGLDHILFVVALVLFLPAWRRILLLVSTFTVAHSLTFILAGSEVFSLSARIVEPIIAGSIGVAALWGMWQHYQSSSSEKISPPSPLLNQEGGVKRFFGVGLVFFFGLFHGLGFAGLLENFQIPMDKFWSSLIFFNIGVEIGQILVLLLVLPILLLIRKIFPKISGQIFSGLAILVASMGFFWMVERILG